ncbi:LLM class flavin-dependent oxidoreductase [Pseudomonas sp. MRSN 12121]|uniref:LLM class flavin-dependent oxidoreductase n=1 Tax=Pseudomonas sp. MRSN 12121 TaxID=1611770 RepID=UPI0005BEF207|nr:LLM class flavin-dependent oxidoreductase [Pseudomonas sp. MRSN 12121]AJO78593.1 monooxygenase [Pseudomonas sp. MRSN 12121]
MALEFSWQMPLCGPGGAPDWAARPGQWIQLAQAVEYAGIDGLWIPGGARCADSLGVAAALCAHTRRVRLTVSVPPEVMLPAALASTLQSLQSISANRVRLHLPDSEQGSLRSAFGEWLNRDQRNERIGEYLEILDQLLAEADGGFNYSGRYFQLENAGFARRPLPAPALILDDSQSGALIARHADLCLLRSAPPNWLRQEIERLRGSERGAARPLGFACAFGLVLGDTEALAWEAASRQLAADLAPLPTPGAAVPRLPRDSQPLRHFEIHPNLVQLQPGQPLYLVGTPHQLATRLQELHGLGLEHIVIQGQPAVSEVLRFAERLLPLLDDQGLRKEPCQHAQ